MRLKYLFLCARNMKLWYRWIILLLYLYFDRLECRGTTGGGDSVAPILPKNYRARRYGGYYSTRYFSYSGVGHARYSRVYRGSNNYYTEYYNYMLSWLGSSSFKVYKNTPSESISVCRNYEANENGTFLGLFTCPLPFEPSSHSYCCGYPNAEYCCRFWDLPNNVVAATICAAMVLGIVGTAFYIVVQLCINTAKIRAEKRYRVLKQAVGKLQRPRVIRRRSSPTFVLLKNGDLVHNKSRKSSLNLL